MLDPERHKEKTASNRASSAAYLRSRGIEFSEHNNGAHLIVGHNGLVVDFWPGTGLWIVRNGRKGRGVRNLVRELKKEQINAAGNR
jgi:hypothetical protein